jgi:hypothetical protein
MCLASMWHPYKTPMAIDDLVRHGSMMSKRAVKGILISAGLAQGKASRVDASIMHNSALPPNPARLAGMPDMRIFGCSCSSNAG